MSSCRPHQISRTSAPSGYLPSWPATTPANGLSGLRSIAQTEYHLSPAPTRTPILNTLPCWTSRKVNWAERDYEVSTDNAFMLRGHHSVLTGAPELIVSRDKHTLIVSVPTGPPLRSHGTLVRIYMYALRRAQGPYRGIVLPGELVYPDRTQHVPQGGVDQGLIRRLGALINRVVADEPAVRVPSTHECGPAPSQIARCGWPAPSVEPARPSNHNDKNHTLPA